MKIQATQDQLVIDNPSFIVVAVGAVLVVAGLAVGIYYGAIHHASSMLAVGFGLAILGALMVVFSKSSHIVLAKSGDSSVSTKTLFSESKSQTFSLADASFVLLEARETRGTTKDADGTVRDQTSITSNMFLLTRSGLRIQLGTATQAMNIGGIIGELIQSLPLRSEADQIAKFVGVPLQCSDAIGPGQRII